VGARIAIGSAKSGRRHGRDLRWQAGDEGRSARVGRGRRRSTKGRGRNARWVTPTGRCYDGPRCSVRWPVTRWSSFSSVGRPLLLTARQVGPDRVDARLISAAFMDW